MKRKLVKNRGQGSEFREQRKSYSGSSSKKNLRGEKGDMELMGLGVKVLKVLKVLR